MTDKHTLDLARQWAADIDADRQTLSQDTIDAAADLISSLPESWVGADTLRRYIADWREGLATAPRGNYEAEMLDDLEALLPATGPRPEDVPAGEPWIVEYGGHKWVGTREEGGRTDYEWSLARLDGVDYDPAPDDEVTLIARLVPETTDPDDVEQDNEPNFDPAYTYLDRGGRTWGKSYGLWVQADTPGERRERRARGAGLETPPDHWGPYTCAEKQEGWV